MRVSYVMPQNVGPAACRNYGALLSQSGILVFLDCGYLRAYRHD